MTQPTDVSRLHRQAIVDLLNDALAVEQTGGAYTVYVGEVTTAEADITYPYLVVWPPPVTRPTNLLNGSDGAATTVTQITAAGTTTDEVLAALDRAGTALHRRRPNIIGRRCTPITQLPTAEPPQPGRDDRVNTPTGRPVFFAPLLFSLYSTPAGGNT